MVVSSIQDRTNEFRSVLTQVQKRQASSKAGSQRQSLLTDAQKAANGSADGKPRRSEFARRAAEIGRGIGGTMSKLEKLAQRTY
jgi:syntaxin 5